MLPSTIHHAFPPVFDDASQVLILGTMPSPKSRENRFYYSHPQNRFWPLLADLFADPQPASPEAKQAFALRHHIALWDVLARCDIRGASDASIKNPQPNDIAWLIGRAPIHTIFTTGKTATQLYERLLLPKTGLPAIYLPSTSPANRAAYPYPKLKEAWLQLLACLKD